MLRAISVSAKQAAAYYQAENNISEKEAKNYSEWFGKGADEFGLKGKIKNGDFDSLLNGKHPNGEKFRTRQPTQSGYKERAGLDLTFSASKSISIAVLVNEDKQLELAHREAVNTALKALETKYASTRIRQDGKRNTVYTGNLAIAQFHHDRSRANDPQLHTHAIVINATQNKNGDWYSLKNDEILQNQKFFDSIYQNELANKARKLGYEIQQQDNGSFELAGYSTNQLKHFSKRRQQIIKQAGEGASAKEREIAALKTRKPKIGNISRKELQAQWKIQANEIGIIHPQANKNISNKTYLKDPRQLVDDAVSHLSEKQTSFERKDIEQFALKQLGNNSWTEIQFAINNHRNLIKAKDNKYTTLSALNRELYTIRIIHRSQGTVEQIDNHSTVERKLKNKRLTQGQKDAVLSASTTTDKITAWQGKAGAGKTYALNEFKAIAESKGYTIKGFAPSASAAKTLGDELGIESNTVARKLISEPNDLEQGQKQFWIVDEAGLLSASDAHKLLLKAESEKARILLVGDTRQLSAVGAGNPFKSIQKAGVEVAYLNQSLRQKSPDLKLAVEQISEGNLESGIKILDDNNRIVEIANSTTRAKKIADDYIKLTPGKRYKTLILAGTHRDRTEIINQIRSLLKDEGVLGKDIASSKLKSQDLSNTQKNAVQNYQQGDLLVFHRNYARQNLNKGELYTVAQVKTNSLVLESRMGIKHEINPARLSQKSVYRTESIGVATGDRLKWTKNDNALGRRNGQEFWIDRIDDAYQATIRYENGKNETINLLEPQHFDHALVSTTYSSQGKTAEGVIISATSDRTLSQESFYVGVSRAKHDLKIYAQNKDDLLSKVRESHSQQNPLDLLAENSDKIASRVEKNLRGVFTNYLKQQETSSPQQKAEQKNLNKSIKANEEIVQESPSRRIKF